MTWRLIENIYLTGIIDLVVYLLAGDLSRPMGDNPDFHVDEAAGFPMDDLNNDEPTDVVNSPATQSGTLS